MFKFLKSLVVTKPTVVYVIGPTASGKTSFSIDLAKQLIAQGRSVEIISADSRQIYQEIPIFSGAVSEQEMQGVTHHLVGTEQVSETHTAAWFRTRAESLIQNIMERGAIPIVVGGSGFWISGLLFEDDYPSVPPNEDLRTELEQYSVQELQKRLQELDPVRFSSVDIDNPRRLIRSIEIATALGHVPVMNYTVCDTYQAVVAYLDYPKEITNAKITQSVPKRYALGLVAEAETLRDVLSLERFRELGLGYKYIHQYWKGEITKDDLIDQTIVEETRYAKRQRTFFDKMVARLPVSWLVRVTDPMDKSQVINTITKKLL